MQALVKLIEGGTAWIIDRVLAYATERGFDTYTSTRRVDWLVSVEGLSAAVLESLAHDPEAVEMSPDDINHPSTVTKFAQVEARRHWARGIGLGMFLGLFTYYRQSYLDLVDASDLPPTEKAESRRYLGRFFDRAATDVAVEWAEIPEANHVADLRAENRKAVLEKNLYRTMFEFLPEAAIFISPGGRIQGTNQAGVRWFGRSSDSLEGEPAVKTMPWLQPELGELLTGKAGDQRTFSREIQHAGQVCSLDVRLAALRDPAGALTGLVALVEDVTQLRAAHAAIAASEAKLKVKVRQITCLSELAAVLSSTELHSEEILDRAAEIVPRGWLTNREVGAEIVLDGGEHRYGSVSDADCCLSRPLNILGHMRGSVRVCVARQEGEEWNFSPGQRGLLSSIAKQIERALEVRESQAVLGQSEKLFREFFDNAADAIFIHDENGVVLDANRNAGIWLSIATENLLGGQLLDFVAEGEREDMLGRFRDALRDVPALFLSTLRRRDGFSISAEILTQGLHYLGRKALFSSCRNVSTRLRTQAELELRLEQEALIASISSRLINLPGQNLPEAIEASLADVCGFLGMRRAGVFLISANGRNFELAHQWRSEGLPVLSTALTRLNRNKMPWFTERIQAGERVFIRDSNHMPPSGRKEKLLLTREGIASLAAVPMTTKDRVLGVLVVANDSPQDTARLSGSQLLDQVTLLFSNAIEKRRINAALRESESLSRSILDSLQAVLCVVDKSGTLTMTNHAWEVMGPRQGPRVAAGLRVGDNYLEHCRQAAQEGDEYARKSLEGISAVLAGRSSVFALEFPSKVGPAEQWFLLQATPRGHGAQGAVLSHVNITLRVRAGQRLRKNEARYRSLVEAMHEGLLMVRKNGRITFVNESLAAMLGREKNDLMGHNASEFVASGSGARLAELLSGRVSDSGAEEILWSHASGRHIYTLVSPSRTVDEEGVVTGSFAVITDTTDRKNLESQLLQSQKLEAIGQLAAGIAHEINTPAQYVGNNVQFLKGACDDMLVLCRGVAAFVQQTKASCPTLEQVAALERQMADCDVEYLAEEIPGAIAQTLEGVERINVIVRSVKQFAHPGAAIMAPADLNESMKSTVTVSRNEWKYVAELVTELDPNLPLVVCMIGEINQVVLNLIINAAHAIADAKKIDPEREGRITLRTHCNAPWAEIRITDTGTGIPPAVQGRIFDPFFTTKEVGRGTGQGLTISRSIVMEKHGGQLYFETEPGVGTTFVVRLPLEQKSEGSPQ